MFVADKRTRMFCSTLCSAKHRTATRPGFYQAIGHTGGSRSGAARDRTLEARLRSRLGPEATLADAYRLGRAQTRRSLYGNGYRAGYARGWSAAIKEKWDGDRGPFRQARSM